MHRGEDDARRGTEASSRSRKGAQGWRRTSSPAHSDKSRRQGVGESERDEVNAPNWILERLKSPPAPAGSVLSDLDTVSQSAHVFFGGWIVYTFALWTSPWWGVVAVLSFAAIKESWWDQKYETLDEVRGSNLR